MILNQHITPHNCCVQWCIWDKASSTSSLYRSLHLILCFSICHVQASQKVASAHSGWWRLREPRGLHSDTSCVTKQGLRCHCTAWSSGWGPLLLQLRAVSWKKALKRPKGPVGIFTCSMAIGGFSQQEQPQVCKKRKNSKKAAQTKKGFLIWL